MSWSNALLEYAKQDPKKLPADVLIYASERYLLIFDKFPKAHFHWLVLPRLPFKLQSEESATGKEVEITEHFLDNLNALSKSKHCLAVLRVLKEGADKAREMMEIEMLESKRAVWPIYTGFHAAESMKHVHLHVISSDLVSDALKNKKHYQSFRPDLGFFLHLNDVIDWKEAGTLQTRIPPAAQVDKLLKGDLVSYHDSRTYANMPKLKEHLKQAFENQIASLKKEKEKKRKLTSSATPAESSSKKAREDEEA